MTEAEATKELNKAGRALKTAFDALDSIAKTEEIFSHPNAPAAALVPYAQANAAFARVALQEIGQILHGSAQPEPGDQGAKE